MLPALLFYAFTTAQAICIPDFSLKKSSTINTTNCECYYDGIPYTQTEIFAITSGLPINLAFDPVMKDLYFTLIKIELLEDTEVTKLSQYVLKVQRKCRRGELALINNENGQAAAYDDSNKVVYLATDDGLQTIDKTYRPKFHSHKDEDIVQLFKGKKNYMYAVLHPYNYVYNLSLDKNEKMTKVLNVPCADMFAVDNDDNIYFVCNKGTTQMLLKDFQEPIEFVGLPKDAARAMNVDAEGRIIVATNDGLYHLNPNNVIPKKLMNLKISPSGIAIDKEDIYISTNKAIYIYTPCL